MRACASQQHNRVPLGRCSLPHLLKQLLRQVEVVHALVLHAHAHQWQVQPREEPGSSAVCCHGLQAIIHMVCLPQQTRLQWFSTSKIFNMWLVVSRSYQVQMQWVVSG